MQRAHATDTLLVELNQEAYEQLGEHGQTLITHRTEDTYVLVRVRDLNPAEEEPSDALDRGVE